MNLKIFIAQVNVVAGNPKANYERMSYAIKQACHENNGADVIVFPEMNLPGYLLGDMWERHSFLYECMHYEKKILDLSRQYPETLIAFGNVKTNLWDTQEDGRSKKHNCCVVVLNGEIVKTYVKTLQPNYREFDDNRHFYDFRKYLFDTLNSEGYQTYCDAIKTHYAPVEFKGHKLGFMLCEDGWENDYTFSPMEHISKKADLIFNISCSPFTRGKYKARNKAFNDLFDKYKVPIVYVNSVGIQNNGKNIYTFDGDSGLYNEGKFTSLGAPFQEFITELNFHDHKSKNLMHYDEIGMLKMSLIKGIRMFLEQSKIKKVVIGASGGIDSAVVASLFAEILPPKDIYLVNMPSKFNSDTTKDLAKQLADNIGCNYNIIPIQESVNQTVQQLEENGFIITDFVKENIQARDRSSRILAGVSASVGGVFTCNANKSEFTVGYTTLYGDLGGFLAPLADVWKTDVYKLAKYINNFKVKDIIPQGSIDVKASAELSDTQNVDKGQGDPIIYEYHDKLFYSWTERWNRWTPEDVLESLLRGDLEKDLGVENKIIETYFNGEVKLFIEDLERWWNLFDGFAYAKRIQSPPNITVSRRSYGFDLRETQIPPFYSQRYCELKNKII
jgi:NAD+ synthase (glutamine-hydrolysing)